MRQILLPLSVCVCAMLTALPSSAQSQPTKKWLTSDPVPQWIWTEKNHVSNQKIYLRTSVDVPAAVKSAPLYCTCDNRMTLWINGQQVASSTNWQEPVTLDAAKFLQTGKNVIAVEAQNEGGIAALAFKLSVNSGQANAVTRISDASWVVSSTTPAEGWQAVDFDASGWKENNKPVGRLGQAPWGVPGWSGGSAGPGQVTAPEDLDVAEGFAVDLIYTVPKDEQGSWVSLANGPDGTLLACDQAGKGLFSITVKETKEGPQATVRPMPVPRPEGPGTLSAAQGLLWAFDSLWFHQNGGHLYRVTDTNGDGVLDHSEQIPSQTGGGEHGNHAVILSADQQAVLMDGGNHAPLHEVHRARVQSWQEDQLLPRMWDANGHARGKLAPGGWVTRLNPTTQQQKLICIGFRNQYDIALNAHGDIFTYDADMEWDLGTPWYRPTRICHVVSGGDYGWRSGTGKWPTYYEDSLPPVVEIGPGSPTGVASGAGAKFPAEYEDAIYALDWTFGTIYAIHLTPEGAGYRGRSEAFVTGAPLPVTDAVVAADGNLYFTVGGRGAQSGLYRVRYTNPYVSQPPRELPSDVRAARQARQQLEQYHGVQDPAAVDAAWPYLSSSDRFLRHAARVAIESQPVEQWAERAVLEADPQARITASVALARMGNERHQRGLLAGLLELDPAKLTVSQTLGLLRAYALTFIRMGRPDEKLQQQIIARLDPLLPADNADINTELVRVLVYLEAPHIVEKTMRLITNRQPPEIPDWSELASRNPGYGGTVQKVLDNHPPAREIGYALMLKDLRKGWTIDLRRQYFEFLNVAAKGSGGASFPGFLTNIREEALGNCSDAERAAVASITGETFDPVPDFEIQPIQGPGQKWTVAEAMRQSARGFQQASFERGRSLYFAASCGNCHRFNGLGGNIGPDLTSVRNKFDVGYVVEHILEPSKIISDQYQSSVVLTDDGRAYTGLVSEADGQVVIYPADAKAEPIKLSADSIEEISPSPTSQMPTGLIDGLNKDEVRDLLAYLMSGGNPQDRRVYGK